MPLTVHAAHQPSERPAQALQQRESHPPLALHLGLRWVLQERRRESRPQAHWSKKCALHWCPGLAMLLKLQLRERPMWAAH